MTYNIREPLSDQTVSTARKEPTRSMCTLLLF